MEFDPSRRLFLRRAGLASVAPIIAPMLPIERLVKYFFAPAGGWGMLDRGVSLRMVRSYDIGNSRHALRIDSLYVFSALDYENISKVVLDVIAGQRNSTEIKLSPLT